MNLYVVAWTALATTVVALLWQWIVSHTDELWQAHKAQGGALVAWYVVTFPMVFVSELATSLTIIAAVAWIFLILNACRLWMDRFASEFLRREVVLSSAWLTVIISVAVAVNELTSGTHWHVAAFWLTALLLVLSAVAGAGMVWRSRWALRYYRAGKIKRVAKESELPTVTLAIPARNETHALDETLALAIKSDYPKLEILVLDDCSQDATAHVIRSYARDGVRFVQGKVPASGWQGKNYACEVLTREASGELLVFAGVDTHFGPQTISELVSYMLHTHAEMVSVLPQRRESDFWPAFLESLRNFWQLVLPIGPRRVPISSPCWAIWRDNLRRLGGFASVKHSVFPEEHFARQLHTKHAYRFVVADDHLEVTTRKKLSSQLETATRTLYPLLKRRPSNVLLVAGVAALLLLPYAVLLWQLVYWEWNALALLAAAAIAGPIAAHALLLRRLSPQLWWLGFINFPVLVIFDTLLYTWSMLQFEFGEVNWKGRNVCYPLLEVIPMREFTAELEHRET